MRAKEPTLSELLAHRDGEPVDLQVAREIERSAAAGELQSRLGAIKSELRELPGIEPPAGAWHAIRTASARRERRPKMPALLAMAAGIFLAAMLTVVLVDSPETDRRPGALAEPDLAALIRRSQELESRIVPAWFAQPTPSQQALVYRIADIDAELFGLYGEGTADATRQATLWRQRVEMLENLQTVQRGQALLRPAAY